MTQVTITREDSSNKARYVAVIDGVEGAGELTLSKVNDSLVIADHTSTPDSMRGMGVAAALANRLLEDARNAGQQVIPLCPFLKSYAQRHPERAAGVIKS